MNNSELRPMKRALVIGSGLTGSTAAWKLASQGWQVRVHEASPFVGGHVRTCEFNGIQYEQNGIHVFHTNIREIYELITRFVELIDYKHLIMTEIENLLLTWPLQLEEVKRLDLWNEIERELQNLPTDPDATNFETYAISIMGATLYGLFIQPYTLKQWGVDPRRLSSSFAPKRIGLRDDGDKPIFRDQWQGWPKGGWNKVIEGLLTEYPIEILLGRTELESTVDWNSYDAVIVTAPLDDFLKVAQLPWRGVRVEHQILPDMQGMYLSAGQINHPGLDQKYTRRTETKWMSGQGDRLGTVVTHEYPTSELKHYPVDDSSGENRRYANSLKEELIKMHPNALVAGRLANYVYINTDQAMMQGLHVAEKAMSKFS